MMIDNWCSVSGVDDVIDCTSQLIVRLHISEIDRSQSTDVGDLKSNYTVSKLTCSASGQNFQDANWTSFGHRRVGGV